MRATGGVMSQACPRLPQKQTPGMKAVSQRKALQEGRHSAGKRAEERKRSPRPHAPFPRVLPAPSPPVTRHGWLPPPSEMAVLVEDEHEP